jgi:hypothetical protein
MCLQDRCIFMQKAGIRIVIFLYPADKQDGFTLSAGVAHSGKYKTAAGIFPQDMICRPVLH